MIDRANFAEDEHWSGVATVSVFVTVPKLCELAVRKALIVATHSSRATN